MDSGLGVRWPLSPLATALAAGALFAFCFALWKQRSPPGRKPDTRSKIPDRVDNLNISLDPKTSRTATHGKSENAAGRPVSDVKSGINKRQPRNLESSSPNPEAASSGDPDQRESGSDVQHGVVSGSFDAGLLESILPYIRPVITQLCRSRSILPRPDFVSNKILFDFGGGKSVLFDSRVFNDRPITRAAINISVERGFYYSVINRYITIRESIVNEVSPLDNPIERQNYPAITDGKSELDLSFSGDNEPPDGNKKMGEDDWISPARVEGVVTVSSEEKNPEKKEGMSFANSGNRGLEEFQKAFDNGVCEPPAELSLTLEAGSFERVQAPLPSCSTQKLERKRGFPLERDVTSGEGVKEWTTSLAAADDREAHSLPWQMDRRTGERSVDCGALPPACVFESSVTSETRIKSNGDARVSTAVVSRLTLEDWASEDHDVQRNDTVDNKVELFRPTFEEFAPTRSTPTRNGTADRLNEISGAKEAPPRVSRLMGLLNRDEERRARAQFLHIQPEPPKDPGEATGEGEWDRLLRDVLASVSELERWEESERRRRRDVSNASEDAENDCHPRHHSDSSPAMEEEALSPKGETPTKVKNLRFKLDPDVFDVPSDDSFYDDEEDDANRRPGWRKQSKYRTFSSLELGDEPVRLVSVHASVVPAGQKMVARPVGIDLRVRLTEERQSKRAHVGTSPSQAKRRSPVSDRGVGWCQELSPVTENVDWRETFAPVSQEQQPQSPKTVPNGILKSPSPRPEPDSENPFKGDETDINKNPAPTPAKPVQNGSALPWKPPRKHLSLPRKKFEPDPEAIERITGYKIAIAKPPLPPPAFHRVLAPSTARNRAEQARKQYLDTKASLAAAKMDGAKKFQQFLTQAQSDRAKIVTSVPDLGEIERAVSEQWAKERASVSPRETPERNDPELKTDDDGLSSRVSTPDDAWSSYVQTCRRHLGRRSQSLSYLETDIDIPVLQDDDKCQSTSALDDDDDEVPAPPDDTDYDRSREDLDDSGRAKSEHELRVERSLRSLPLPDWYRQSDKPKTGFLLGSGQKEKRGWAAAKSLASSTSSLASCGLKRPLRSLRSSRENIPWSRSSASPDGPALSLALAKAFREPYLGWRARTPTSSGVSSSPRASPPSWGAVTTDDEANGISFDGEDAFGRTSSEEDRRDEPPSLDDTGADAVTVSMDTGDPVKLPGGEDTCDDINNMSMDTCELFDASVMPEADDPSPQADTGDDIDNLSTDTTDQDRRKDAKLKRYSYSQSIYNSEWEEEEESRGDCKSLKEDSPSSEHKVIWIESSFVGSRTTTSIVVLPEDKVQKSGNCVERPASR